MSSIAPYSIDMRHLQYFAVVAEESSLHRAAQRLMMSQPPLSAHIKNLEERLGVALFVRHSKGVSLTDEGSRVLALVRPLLDQYEHTLGELAAVSMQEGLVLGLTTGFEHGAFRGVEARLREMYANRLSIVRNSSNPLIQDMRKGKVDASLVALPLEAPGLTVVPLPYAEARILAVPSSWPESQSRGLSLRAFTGRPLFRLSRAHNPGFYAFTQRVFTQAGFAPIGIVEPLEHDVLLARIAAGEGMGLFPLSFTAIRREGIEFVPVMESNLLQAQLAIAAPEHKRELLDKLVAEIMPVLPRSRLVESAL